MARIIILIMMAALMLSIVPVSVYAATVPSAPTGLSGVSNAGIVYLGWAEPTDDGGSAITGYRVYRGIMEDGLGIVEDVSGMSYSDTGLSTGQTYYYAVSALNAEGESVKTDIVSVMIEDEAPLMVLIHVEDYTTFTIIYVGEGVYFDIAGGRHEVMVESITGTNTLISIDQGAMSYTMKEGDSKTVDVNNDGTNDFVIKCETIKWSNTEAVELSFTKAPKETKTGVPGFELWTLLAGALVALNAHRLSVKKSA
ncbi:fibronectin type III domain-containing protein, partial [Candidatus Bathyarchaeota archaeon]|nr:fibronectin type III domain-containing protein [Candidatus Bathyarchaeota archaeon]